MKLTRLALAAVAALTLTGAAQAQDYKFGGQITLSKPSGDFGDTNALDGKIGYGLGGHMLIDLKGGHAIVPRLDYIMYKRSEGAGDLKVNVLSLGADYNYYISGKANEGFYLTVGLGYDSASVKVEEYSVEVFSKSKGCFAYGAGLGYMFTPNVGAELKYNYAKYDFSSDGGPDMTAPSINASFIFRF